MHNLHTCVYVGGGGGGGGGASGGGKEWDLLGGGVENMGSHVSHFFLWFVDILEKV